MFLRPLDDGRPQSAKKMSALDAFGAPAASPSGPKVRRKRLRSSKSPEKAIPKSMQKMMPEKDTKCIPKAFQNHAKTDTTIVDLVYFCEEGWNAPNCLFSNRKRGSGHPTIEKIPSRFRRKLALSIENSRNFDWLIVQYYSESSKLWRVFCWNFEIWTVQRNIDLVDLEKCCKMLRLSLS